VEKHSFFVLSERPRNIYIHGRVKLDDYLRQEFAGTPRKGMVGAESEWLDFCALDLSSGNVRIVDWCYITEEEEGCIIALRPGQFELKVKLMAFGDDIRVSRLRLMKANANPTVGGQIGGFVTDSARFGVYDFETFSAEFKKSEEAVNKAFEPLMFRTEPHGIVKLSDSPGPSCR
jgi:hypothetical protein